MQVILIKDVENLGYANDIVEVRPGYANNYLIPQDTPKSATASARKVLAENLKQQAHKEARRSPTPKRWQPRLAEIALTITAKAEEGRIFGSVTAANVAEALNEKGIAVDRKSISVDPVKTIGAYEAAVKPLQRHQRNR